MAKRKAKERKGNEPGAPSAPEAVPVTIVTTSTDDTPSYYCNFAETVYSAHEMAINFVRVPTKLTAMQVEEMTGGGKLNLEPNVQVFFPPTLLPGLVRALSVLRENFERQFGAIREDET